MKKHIGKIIFYTLLVVVVFSIQFGLADIIRKNLFPNDRDRIETQFHEVFERDESQIASPFSWDHPGNSKERAAFIVRLKYHGDDLRLMCWKI